MKMNKQKIWIFIFVLVVASTLGLYLRLYTLRNNISHDVNEKATLIVINNIRSTTYQSIEKSNPSLPPTQKVLLAKKQFDAIIHNEAPKVRETIDRVAREIQEQTQGKNTFYLPEADSYYYYNLTENILNTGRISEKIQGSKYFNNLMNAPHGYWEPLNLHPYIGFYVYKIVKFFNPKISLMEGVSYTPLLMTILVLFAFLVGCMILKCSPWMSLLGAIYLVCIPVFLRRSMFGWYKNDPTNIFFLFLIPAVFFYGLKYIDRRRNAIYSAALCSILLALYSLFWQGWVFLASLIIASGFFILLYSFFARRNKQQSKNILIFFSIIIGGAFLGVSIIFGPTEFFILFREGWSALQDFINPKLSMWPDLYIAVGELISPTPQQWLDMLGGPFFISVGVLGIILRTIQLFRRQSDDSNLATIFLIIFWIVGVKLSFGAQRFGTLCLIPFSLSFAIGAQYIFDYTKKAAFKIFPLIRESRFGQGLLVAGVILLLSFPPVKAAEKKTPEILNRIFNSTWDAALTKIKNETPKESIINTWWPPGHFIKAISQRRVTFDGATINKPQSYWLANAFLATDEQTSAGILRMLNDSGNDATDYLLSEGFDLPQTINLLKRIVALSETHARQTLKTTLNKNQIDKLLSLTHTSAPPSYLLLYDEMANSNMQFSFVGNWDFKKVALINNDPDARSHIPSRGSKEYVPFLWRLAGGPGRYSGTLVPINNKNDIILFENNVRIDTKAMTCEINSPKFGKGIPRSLFYEKDGVFIEKKLNNANLPYSVMLINDGPDVKCILSETTLARSMLLRLYFYGGKGLKIFEPFADERDATGRTRIVVYKINWKNF